MMKRIYRFKIELLCAFLLSFTACDYLDVDPQYTIAPETFYDSEEKVVYGLTGVYGVINSEALYGNYYSLMLSNGDDLCYYNRSTSGSYPYQYSHSTSDTYVYQAWSKLYEGVKNANEFMMAVEESEFDEDGTYYAEARFLRAYYYFLLAQAWGDVPLRTTPATSPSEVEMAATPQLDVLKWCVDEMVATLPYFEEGDLSRAPYNVTRSAVQGILARVYLFLAGERGVSSSDDKKQMYTSAAYYAGKVISDNIHRLNSDYSQVFINMISDVYDTTNYESIWEADFAGNHSAGSWSNGRIGDLLGLQGQGTDEKYSEWTSNYSYGQYNGSLKLWRLFSEDRAEGDEEADERQEWNLPWYNYLGNSGLYLSENYDPTPYSYNGIYTSVDPTVAGGQRNAGKFRRETKYEGAMTSKMLYTHINFPILRYSDVLLMYAEATNEVGDNISLAYDALVDVRERAGISTDAVGTFDQTSLRDMIRNERARELAFEGLRKYDLVRWGIFVEQMNNYVLWAQDEEWKDDDTSTSASKIGANVQAKHVVLPIPSVELGVNSLLKQNILWQ